jgi:hypothetical protein
MSILCGDRVVLAANYSRRTAELAPMNSTAIVHLIGSLYDRCRTRARPDIIDH